MTSFELLVAVIIITLAAFGVTIYVLLFLVIWKRWKRIDSNVRKRLRL